MSDNVDKLQQAILDADSRNARRDMMDTLMTFGDDGQEALIEIADATEKKICKRRSTRTR